MPLQRPEDLKGYQRGPMEARAVLLQHIDQIVMIQGLSASKAIDAFVDLARSGELPAELQKLLPVANARWRPGRALCRATIYGWRQELGAAEGNVAALAPVAKPEAPIPSWAETLMRLYAKPTKPDVTEALANWPKGEVKPSYDQARRFLKRLDAITRNQGRMGPRALKSLKAYIARDTSELWPGAVFIGDGHTYKQEVAHPIHGRPFRPEVTSMLDVYTHRWVGWSAALSENTWAVADALRHALTTTTCCDILYYDNGAGARNCTWDDDCIGIAARTGMTKLHSAPWTSQSRGIIERFHSSVLHRVARERPSYVGQRMDEEARRKAFKITRAEIKEAGVSRLLTAWTDFIADIDAAMVEYNDRPHSSLPKVVDAETGKRRHMSPNEMWAQAVADGWEADPMPVDEARTLFRPHVRRKVVRAIVNLFGNEYFHADLEVFHGEEVVVGYDIHNAATVIISHVDGRVICEAKWGGNKRSYVPVTMAQHSHEHRVKGKLNRLGAHVRVAEAELGPKLIEHAPAAPFDPVRLAEGEAELERMTAIREAPPPRALNGRPVFRDDAEWSEWLIANPDQVTETDREHLRAQLREWSFLQLMEMRSVDAATLREIAHYQTKVA